MMRTPGIGQRGRGKGCVRRWRCRVRTSETMVGALAGANRRDRPVGPKAARVTREPGSPMLFWSDRITTHQAPARGIAYRVGRVRTMERRSRLLTRRSASSQRSRAEVMGQLGCFNAAVDKAGGPRTVPRVVVHGGARHNVENRVGRRCSTSASRSRRATRRGCSSTRLPPLYTGRSRGRRGVPHRGRDAVRGRCPREEGQHRARHLGKNYAGTTPWEPGHGRPWNRDPAHLRAGHPAGGVAHRQLCPISSSSRLASRAPRSGIGKAHVKE